MRGTAGVRGAAEARDGADGRSIHHGETSALRRLSYGGRAFSRLLDMFLRVHGHLSSGVR
jgi:hypothetical protein